ncbi:DNA-3-methyladenine glycosylase [Halanaerobium saccharolyticum]|uniref:Putative 3-methyladenine DNA glycosylase n=1 Tax=Halanaerobium saccharolyticum TaxID=43595 RepID=A0A4R7Z6R0_9FIRM|nr:DNA-3-methyladenine glycosylase [Halanaerobium saccharolyticum]RAK11220.1 DNA-3-methyladenine glycosylase [Halanaerobium saccharolyticum]TDW07071.1 DNA-3-methyladenine glycosylase [Halanaerobium saccharolyticum]TDX63836.1 DNA-3-methyladenine glycosylase [Halanaerobium saccharolyticum]
MKLDYDFYQKDAVTAAKDLLGKILVREIDGQKIMVKIVDTEAYLGTDDKASHAYNNKKTKRTETMFARGGLAYIYLIYGMYHCFNIVTAEVDNPHAVLIRAVEPVEGLQFIKENRKLKSKKIENLTNGPGKLSQALKIDKSLDGCNLVKSNKLYLLDNKDEDFKIEAAPRVNIDYAEEYKNKKWRFYIKENKFVSQS